MRAQWQTILQGSLRLFGRFKEVTRREEGKKAKAKLEREIKGAHVLGRRKMANFQRRMAKGQSEG